MRGGSALAKVMMTLSPFLSASAWNAAASNCHRAWICEYSETPMTFWPSDCVAPAVSLDRLHPDAASTAQRATSASRANPRRPPSHWTRIII